jgi:hypothetical protein
MSQLLMRGVWRQICCVYRAVTPTSRLATEAQQNDPVRGTEKASWRSVSPIDATEREQDRGGSFDAGSCAYDDCDTTEIFGIQGNRVCLLRVNDKVKRITAGDS